MDLYLAGNFVIMGDLEAERKLKKTMGKSYYRLGSFYFKKQTKNLVKIKKEQKC